MKITLEFIHYNSYPHTNPPNPFGHQENKVNLIRLLKLQKYSQLTQGRRWFNLKSASLKNRWADFICALISSTDPIIVARNILKVKVKTFRVPDYRLVLGSRVFQTQTPLHSSNVVVWNVILATVAVATGRRNSGHCFPLRPQVAERARQQSAIFITPNAQPLNWSGIQN